MYTEQVVDKTKQITCELIQKLPDKEQILNNKQVQYIINEVDLSGHTRTAAVIGGGIKGFAIGGPFAAMAGGIIGGFTTDAVVTSINSAYH